MPRVYKMPEPQSVPNPPRNTYAQALALGGVSRQLLSKLRNASNTEQGASLNANEVVIVLEALHVAGFVK